jgi:hypothetical protein
LRKSYEIKHFKDVDAKDNKTFLQARSLNLVLWLWVAPDGQRSPIAREPLYSKVLIKTPCTHQNARTPLQR